MDRLGLVCSQELIAGGSVIMAVPSPALEGKRGGKNTPEYKKMLNKMQRVIDALVVTPGAKQQLDVKCKEKSWFTISASVSEGELIEFVLERVNQNADQFDVFLSMLNKIDGMDQVVADLRLQPTGIS